MSADLRAMIKAAARMPEDDPGPVAVWRRARRRRTARLASMAVASAAVVAASGLLMSGQGLQPVVEAMGVAGGGGSDVVAEGVADPVDEAFGRWRVRGIGVLLDVPLAWKQSGEDPLARSGETGYVRLALGTGPVTVEQACELERERPGSPFAASTEIELRIVDGEQACLLRPVVGDAALAVVALPYPPAAGAVNGRSYLFVQTDAGHLDAIVDSVYLIASGTAE